MLGVTKEAYFEICAAVGSEPVESEIPIDFEDLNISIQETFGLYYKLKDHWDSFNGSYLGKEFNGIKDIFEILEIPRENWKMEFELITLIDHYRSTHIKKMSESKKSST